MMSARLRAGGEARVAVERGFLVIADISGYTDYVVESPLVHAEDVLADVTAAVADRLAGALRINKLEGDAVFGYARDEETDASMLLDAVEAAYTAFRQRLGGIAHATSCDCNACAKLPDLDLKFVLHHGEFARRPGRGGEELTGGPVIAVHRLLKNTVAQAFQTRGYALLTEECVEALGLDPAAAGLRPHDGAAGDRAYVLDLAERYERGADARRVYVGADEALFEVEQVVPAPPALAWEYLTAPARRTTWYGGAVEQMTDGPRGEGTVFCVDGRARIYEEVLDWRPFEYFSESRTLRGGGALILTTELGPAAEGTRVRTRAGAGSGRTRILTRVAARPVRRRLEEGYARLRRILASESERVPGREPAERC